MIKAKNDQSGETWDPRILFAEHVRNLFVVRHQYALSELLDARLKA